MIETITPPSRAGGTGFERTEIQNRKIVGTIRNVGRGDCYAPYFMVENGKVLLWYIDMTAKQGIDVDGVPYFDDLYLDLVVYPDGTIIVDDMDELEEALSKKDITQEQFNLAVETSHRLQREMLSNIPSFIEYTKRCYEMIRKLQN